MSITLPSDEAQRIKIENMTSRLLVEMPKRQKRGFKRLVELIAKGLALESFGSAPAESHSASLSMESCELNGLCDMPKSPGLDAAFKSLDQPYAGTDLLPSSALLAKL